MEDNENKQAEARRMLDAIRKKDEQQKPEKEPVPQKAVHWLVSEDAAQLQALVDQSRGIKNQPVEDKKEPLLDPESIDPISVEQIKVMRKVGATAKEKKELPMRALYGVLIRAYCEMVDFFKPAARAKRCLLDGHQCLHCGEKFPAVPLSTSDSPETSAQQSTGRAKP